MENDYMIAFTNGVKRHSSGSFKRVEFINCSIFVVNRVKWKYLPGHKNFSSRHCFQFTWKCEKSHPLKFRMGYINYVLRVSIWIGECVVGILMCQYIQTGSSWRIKENVQVIFLSKVPRHCMPFVKRNDKWTNCLFYSKKKHIHKLCNTV